MRSIPEIGAPPRPRSTGEAGFTLIEMLVALVITVFLLAAVLAVFRTTQHSVFRASAAEDSLVQARAVVDKFGGDFRMVGAARISFAAPILAASATSIRFEGDIDNTLATDNSPVTLTANLTANAASMIVSDATNIACGTRVTLADGPIAENHTLPTACKSGNTITFGTVTCPTATGGAGDRPCIDYPAGSFVYTVETVHWVWDQASGRLCRRVNATCPTAASSWNDDTDVIASGVSNFSLSYFNRTGATLALSGGTLPSSSFLDVRSVRVSITIRSVSGDQTVTRTMDLTARARNIVP